MARITAMFLAAALAVPFVAGALIPHAGNNPGSDMIPEENQVCSLCGSLATNTARDILCDPNISTTAADECACEDGNYSGIHEHCHVLCQKIFSQGSVNICGKKVARVADSGPTMTTSNIASSVSFNSLTIMPIPPAITPQPLPPVGPSYAYKVHEQKHKSHTPILGSFYGPCGPIGAACKVIITDDAGVTSYPTDVVTATIDGNVYYSTQYTTEAPTAESV